MSLSAVENAFRFFLLGVHHVRDAQPWWEPVRRDNTKHEAIGGNGFVLEVARTRAAAQAGFRHPMAWVPQAHSAAFFQLKGVAMNEILPGVFHWVTVHDHINMPVSSYYLDGPEGAVLIDPRVPDEGLEWFAGHTRPEHVFLTNRHHYRQSDRFVSAFGCGVWCHRDGVHEFTHGEQVTGFVPECLLPGGVEALEVGAICPDETALYIPWARSLSLADGLVRSDFDGPLAFVPDFLMGHDPETVKRGLYAAFGRLLERDFDHLLLAHGSPWIGGGREALRSFVEPGAGA